MRDERKKTTTEITAYLYLGPFHQNNSSVSMRRKRAHWAHGSSFLVVPDSPTSWNGNVVARIMHLKICHWSQHEFKPVALNAISPARPHEWIDIVSLVKDPKFLERCSCDPQKLSPVIYANCHWLGAEKCSLPPRADTYWARIFQLRGYCNQLTGTDFLKAFMRYLSIVQNETASVRILRRKFISAEVKVLLEVQKQEELTVRCSSGMRMDGESIWGRWSVF